MPDQTIAAQEDHNIALPWYEAGASVVPIRADGTKRPTRDWAILQRSRLTREEVTNYWRTPAYGVALICGKISGDLEMTELEALATDEDSLYKIRRACQLRGIVGVWDHLTLQGYAEWTPSGGLHLLYRISDHDVPGNTKLASTPTGQTLAETRGEGGYVIVAPTPGTCHPTREAWTTVAGKQGVIPTITWEQRCLIHEAITSALDESPPPPPPPVSRPTSLLPTGSRPGDEFDTKVEWPEILEPQGWTLSHRQLGGEQFWVRPGKSVRDGHSASTGYADGKDRLYVWSTDAGLPTETPLSKFFVHAHYNFGGDMSAAAKALVKEGYGDMARRPIANELDVWEESEVSLPVRTGYLPSETGNGHRMKDKFGDRFFWNSKEKKWYAWQEGRWAVDWRGLIKQAAEEMTMDLVREAEVLFAAAGDDKDLLKKAQKKWDFAMLSQSNAKLENAISLFANQPGVTVIPEDFDADQNLLNLGNGVLDLTTGELAPHDPKYMMTMKFGADLDPAATAPKWEQFVADVLPDAATREYVQRALGYTLLGKPTERAMFLLHGESGTGKSVLTSVMTKLFGDYGVTAPAATFRMKRNETSLDLHRLRGKRFVATSEMPEGAQLDEELFKRVTGGDSVSSRGHYEEYQEWSPQCVVWIATNFLPKVSSDDNAIWRRAKTVRMNTQFGGDSGRVEIQGYALHLIKEADGILNWLLEGLRQYREYGLQEPAEVSTAIAEYRTDVDGVASFVRDMIGEGTLKDDPEGWVPSSEMLTLYDRYCQQERMTPYGGMRFAQRLKSLGYVSEKVGGVRRWRGLVRDASHFLQPSVQGWQ